MQITITVDVETQLLLQRKKTLLRQILEEPWPCGDVHPLCVEHDLICGQVQMQLGARALQSMEPR